MPEHETRKYRQLTVDNCCCFCVPSNCRRTKCVKIFDSTLAAIGRHILK